MTRACAPPNRTMFSFVTAENPLPSIDIVSPATTGALTLNPLIDSALLDVPARLSVIAFDETPLTTAVRSTSPLPFKETGNRTFIWSSPVKPGAGPEYSTGVSTPPITTRIVPAVALRIPVPYRIRKAGYCAVPTSIGAGTSLPGLTGSALNGSVESKANWPLRLIRPVKPAGAPVPLASAVKIDGAVGAILTVPRETISSPFGCIAVTTTSGSPSARPAGSR